MEVTTAGFGTKAAQPPSHTLAVTNGIHTEGRTGRTNALYTYLGAGMTTRPARAA